jgi:Ca2+-binding EF-hand superfamily protein
MRRILFAAILAITSVTVAVKAEDQKKPATPDFPPRTNMRAEAMKEFDKDGDGKLNDDERKAMMEARKAMGEKIRQAREKEFDKDGDGKLNDEEQKAMMDANKAMREKFMKEREKEFDKDGDGKLSDEERKDMMEKFKQRHPTAGPQFAEMVKRFDKDGDGKLNEEERKAMMEARGKQMQIPRGPRPEGQKPKAPAP